MPGMNALVSADPLSVADLQLFQRVQHAMRHFPSYTDEVLASDEKTCIGLTGPQSYPCSAWTSGDAHILLEGVIYNIETADFRQRLDALVLDGSLGSETGKTALAALLGEADGEFLLVVHEPHHARLTIANDILGRLPTFYAVEGQRLIVSREPKFLYPFLRSCRFDRYGVMAYMMFGFCFGRDTLVEHVVQMEPATILAFDTRRGELVERTQHAYKTDETCWHGAQHAVGTMRDLFVQAATSRADYFEHRTLVVALSGGVDSRAVLAQMAAGHPAAKAITIGGTPETDLARQVASLYGIDLDVITAATSASEAGAMSLVGLKDGLDSDQSHELLHACLQQIEKRYGHDAVLVTGTYGGELTRRLHPTAHIRSTEHLATYLLASPDHYKYASDRTLAILDITEQDARDYLVRYLRTFPEVNAYGKYIRFRHDFDRKYTGNADDRNRFYFWTTTPFAAPAFVRFATSLKENRKNVRLFAAFLNALDPRLCSVRYYDFNIALNSDIQLRGLSIIERLGRSATLKPQLQRLNRWGQFLRRHESAALGPLRQTTLQLLDEEPHADDFLDSTLARRIIEGERDRQGLSRLRVLLLYARWMRAFRRRVEIAA